MMDAAELDKLEQAAIRVEGINEAFTSPLPYFIAVELKMRVNRILSWAAADRSRLAGIASVVGVARNAARELVTHLEAEHNNGRPFPAVPLAAPRSSKRGPLRPQPNTSISVVWPETLYERLRAAVDWQSTTGDDPQRTSLNIMVNQALERYVDRIEAEHPEIRDIALQQSHQRTPGRPSHR